MLHIHPNARTTPATRAEIARSTEPSRTVAQRYGISAETVRKWRKRSVADCLDRSAGPHHWYQRLIGADAGPFIDVRRLPGDQLVRGCIATIICARLSPCS